jgi:hypothetical protein
MFEKLPGLYETRLFFVVFTEAATAPYLPICIALFTEAATASYLLG